MDGMKAKRRQAGFTMLELLVVIAICGILAGIGTSSFKYVTNANRISAEINGLLKDLQFARSEALKEGLPVTVCPANTTGNGCIATNDWSGGWVVFVDLNNNQTYQAAADGLVLRWQKAMPDSLVGSAAALQYVTFNRQGFASSGATASWSTLVLNSNPVNASWKRCLAISAVGAITTEKSGASVPTSC